MSGSDFTRMKAQEWALLNPVLRDGQPGVESISNRLKVGDGRTRWNSLPYMTGVISPPVVSRAEYEAILSRLLDVENAVSGTPTDP